MKSYRPVLSKLITEYKYKYKCKNIPNIKYGNVTLSYKKFLNFQDPIFN